MRRIKSAPANIAEMVNRKKPNLEKQKIQNKKTVLSFTNIIYFKKNTSPIVMKEQVSSLKNQKNIEKTFNNVMHDYINDKEFLHTNDEETLLISILYYYICEKIFTKNNLREFILFIAQILIRYVLTHTLHEIYLTNKDLIDNKLLLLEHIKL